MEVIKELLAFYSAYLRPVLDIAVLTILLFKAFEILMKTQAVQLMRGGIFVLIIYAVAFILDLSTLLWILNSITTGLFIGAAIIFQPELRKIFLTMGQQSWFGRSALSNSDHINAILSAAEYLSLKRRGMLIVFTRQDKLKDIIEYPGSPRLNAEITEALLKTIFEYDTAMHDGAVVIDNGKIISAACYLPLTEQQDVHKAFGTRHRAALGIAEKTDAVVLVVSEESGSISLAYDSKLHYNLTRDDVEQHLKYLLGIHDAVKNTDSSR